MAVSFGPFAGDPGTDPSANLGEDFYMDTIAPAFSNAGVMGDPLTTDLQVTANSSGMQVFVAAGRAVARGVGYYSDSSQTVSIPAASSQPRIDRVVVRFNRSTNTVSAFVLQGTPASSPVPPSVSRTTGGIWDVMLAQVFVPGSAVSIAASNVSDEREFLGSSVIPCRSNARPASTTVRRGQLIYETDTAQLRVWTGSSWATQTPDWAPRGHIASAVSTSLSGSVPTSGAFYTLPMVANLTVGRRYMLTAGGRIGFHSGGAAPINPVELALIVPRPPNLAAMAGAGSGSSTSNELALGDWHIQIPGFHYYSGHASSMILPSTNGNVTFQVQARVFTQRTDTTWQVIANQMSISIYDVGV